MKNYFKSTYTSLIMFKEWNGLKILLPRKNDTNTFKEVLGEFNQYCFHEWMHLLKKEDTAIDLGAHIGLFSLAISRNVNQVLALEPDEENFTYLMDNIAENNLENIIALKKAIFFKDGEGILNVNILNPTKHSLYLNKFLNFEDKAPYLQNVDTISLPSIFQKFSLTFCKLIKSDIEGAEFEVFLKCPQSIIEKVGIFLIEYHEEVTKHGRKELIDFFSDYGFQIHFGEIINYGGLIGGSIRAYNKALFQ